MNTEYVYWFVILAIVGVAVVAYLAAGPVPEPAGSEGVADPEQGAVTPVAAPGGPEPLRASAADDAQ